MRRYVNSVWFWLLATSFPVVYLLFLSQNKKGNVFRVLTMTGKNSWGSLKLLENLDRTRPPSCFFKKWEWRKCAPDSSKYFTFGECYRCHSIWSCKITILCMRIPATVKFWCLIMTLQDEIISVVLHEFCSEILFFSPKLVPILEVPFPDTQNRPHLTVHIVHLEFGVCFRCLFYVWSSDFWFSEIISGEKTLRSRKLEEDSRFVRKIRHFWGYQGEWKLWASDAYATNILSKFMIKFFTKYAWNGSRNAKLATTCCNFNIAHV